MVSRPVVVTTSTFAVTVRCARSSTSRVPDRRELGLELEDAPADHLGAVAPDQLAPGPVDLDERAIERQVGRGDRQVVEIVGHVSFT